MNLLNLWESVSTLPITVSVAVFFLVLFLTVVLVGLPIYFFAKSEIPDLIAHFRSIHTHRPEKYAGWIKVSLFLDLVNRFFGQSVAWLALIMVLTQFSVVILRYVFSWGSVQMQESIWYMHGLIFTLAVGYTLLREGHVRIDLFYRTTSDKVKSWINIIGVLVFIFPVCWITFNIALPYVSNAWAVREGSTEGTGLHFVYLLKTSILFFSALLALQGTSLLIKSSLILNGLDDDRLLNFSGKR